MNLGIIRIFLLLYILFIKKFYSYTGFQTVDRTGLPILTFKFELARTDPRLDLLGLLIQNSIRILVIYIWLHMKPTDAKLAKLIFTDRKVVNKLCVALF